jgi:hypothetical protein
VLIRPQLYIRKMFGGLFGTLPITKAIAPRTIAPHNGVRSTTTSPGRPLSASWGEMLKDAGLACSSAQLSLEAARQLGLPAGSAVIAPEAQSTYDEALNLWHVGQGA